MANASPPRLFASDLDGTLIPVGRDRDVVSADSFREWRGRHPKVALAYLTGRHLELALTGVDRHALPLPDYLGCDVGTSIYRRGETSWTLEEAFRDRMRQSWSGCREVDVLEALHALPGLTPQGADRNTEFKISFFAVPVARLDELVHDARRALRDAGIDANLVDSVDPVQEVGLIDVLPPAASKLSALAYLQEVLAVSTEHTIFAGDSGNDTDALLHGGPAILVGNAPDELRRDLKARARHQGSERSLYVAQAEGAVGVLEGLAHFGLR